MVHHERHILEYHKKKGFPQRLKIFFQIPPDISELLYQYKIIVAHDS